MLYLFQNLEIDEFEGNSDSHDSISQTRKPENKNDGYTINRGIVNLSRFFLHPSLSTTRVFKAEKKAELKKE